MPMLTLTLVLDPSDVRENALEEPRAVAQETLRSLGAEVEARRELAPGEACDLDFVGSTVVKALPALRRAFSGRAFPNSRLDLCVQESARREKRLMVADMESTMIENEMLDELADMVGVRDQVAAITARAMNAEIDFRESLTARVGLLAGVGVDVIEACRDRIRLDPGALTLISTLKAHGVATALVSGGFMSFVRPVAEQLGFDHCQANRLEIEDGRLTGNALEPILDRDAKVSALERFSREHGLEIAQTATIGDGANDLAMLGAAGLGVAYHGKPAVARAAPQRIDVGDLRTLLYFLGYAKESWVS